MGGSPIKSARGKIIYTMALYLRAPDSEASSEHRPAFI